MPTHLQKKIAEIKASALPRRREQQYIRQLQRQGYSGRDLWCLDHHLAQLIHPRLVDYFKGDDHWPRHGRPDPMDPNKIVYNVTVAQARRQRSDVLFAFERIAQDDFFEWGAPKRAESVEQRCARWTATQARIRRGLHIFAHHFQSLWT